MFTITSKVSFSVVVALLLGWAVMSLLIFQSSQYLIATDTADVNWVATPKGVKLVLLVDKKVYRSEEPILISLRNDSRKKIWLASAAAGCPNSWWYLERLGSDASLWQKVARTKSDCAADSSGLGSFPIHTLKTDEWNGLIQNDALGEVFEGVPTGTYRIAVPYLVGKDAVETAWQTDQKLIPSASFTIQ